MLPFCSRDEFAYGFPEDEEHSRRLSCFRERISLTSTELQGSTTSAAKGIVPSTSKTLDLSVFLKLAILHMVQFNRP